MAVKKWEQIPLFDLDPPPVPEVQGKGSELDSEPALFELDDAAAPASDADVDAASPNAADRLDAETEVEPETDENADAERHAEVSTSPVSSVSDTEPAVPHDKRSKDVEPEPTPASERGATEPAALPPASEAADGILFPL